MLLRSLWSLLFLLPIVACSTATGKIIYVDDDGPADFNTIQAAINDANDGNTVIVAPGTYTGDGNRDIDFRGKAITIRSEDGPGKCIIDCQGTKDDPHRGFNFHTNEDANSIVQGFTVTQGYMGPHDGGAFLCIESSPIIRDCIIVGNSAMAGGGIYAYRSDILVENCIIKKNIASYASWDSEGGGIYVSRGNAQLKHCLVVGNTASTDGGGILCSNGNSQIINCTVSENRTGVHGGGILFGFSDGTGTSLLKNSILWQNRAERAGNEIMFYSGRPPSMLVHATNSLIGKEPNDISMAIGYVYDTLFGQWMTGNPLFSSAGHWDPNGSEVPRSNNKPIWIDGDYHLKSQAGRWDPKSQSWIQDDVTSPCIDAGDPNSPIGHEPFPNGGIINMGAYGGTVEASKSYFGEPVCETIIAGDINGDCKVDFKDFAIMVLHWLEER